MESERWQNIERIFNVAVALPPDERAKYLSEACGADTELRAELTSLLSGAEAAATDGDDFLDKPVFALGAQVLERDELLEKSDFASYKLKKVLGRGGMGAVYLAEDTRLGRAVAVKVLPPALFEDAQSLARFQREARAASAISHPNVAHIYEFGETGGRWFMAMEYVEGRTLRQLIKEKALTVPLALAVAKQIALALGSTHKLGIIHRDIKPENIIVKEDNLVKILDFGLAKSSKPDSASHGGEASPAPEMLTRGGLILGTVGYMSPEQIRGGELGAATDLWSLGVVLFEMLAGARPFRGETPSDVQAAILKTEPILPAEPEHAPGVNRILRKALAKNAAERYESALQFAEDIELVQTGSQADTNSSRRNFAASDSTEYSVRHTAAGSRSASVRSLRGRLMPAGMIILAAIAGGLIFQFAFKKNADSDKFSRLRTLRVTNSGNVLRAAVSTDGELLAYVLEESGSRGIFLRRRSASAGAFSPEATALVAPSATRQIRGVTFSPGGAAVYFRAKTPEDTVFNLYRARVEGGEPQKIASDAASAPSFSPDGARMVFLRVNQENSRGDLIIADADGAGERVFQTRQSPDFFSMQAQPAWSPDGKTILCSVGTKADNRERMQPVIMRVADGSTEPVFNDWWQQIWTTQ